MNIPELIKKIREAQKLTLWETYNHDGGDSCIEKLDEVIRELEQQIDDGK